MTRHYPTRYELLGSDFFDRRGCPISVHTFGRLKKNIDYMFLVPNTVIEGVIVTTQWLGEDLENMFRIPPRIFGTCVFRGRRSYERATYIREARAIERHWEIADEVLAQERSKVCLIWTK